MYLDDSQADYISELFHKELRRRSYTNNNNLYFSLGSHVEERDCNRYEGQQGKIMGMNAQKMVGR